MPVGDRGGPGRQDRAASRPEGTCNESLFRAANRAIEAGDAAALNAIARAARAAGLDEREVARTIRSAQRGAERPSGREATDWHGCPRQHRLRGAPCRLPASPGLLESSLIDLNGDQMACDAAAGSARSCMKSGDWPSGYLCTVLYVVTTAAIVNSAVPPGSRPAWDAE